MEEKRRWRAQRFLSSDVTFEFLLRLPAKTLWRFRCVCKSWYALISDPDFGKQHRARSLPNPALLSCSSVRDDDGITFHVSLFDSEGTPVREFTKRGPCNRPFVISTCRDLLLTAGFVCNLATQEVVVTLPPSYFGLALGHVPSTDEYKLLAYDFTSGRNKVLTLGTHQWRDMDASPCGYIVCAAFANGVIHVDVVRENTNTIEIDSFNVEREEWGVLAGPPVTHPNYYVTESSGYLCIVDRVDTNNSVGIWLLKDYDNGLWVKEYTICLSTLKAKSSLKVDPLLIEDDGRLLVQVDQYSLQLYDPKTQSSREIQRFVEMEDAKSFFIKCFSSLGHSAS